MGLDLILMIVWEWHPEYFEAMVSHFGLIHHGILSIAYDAHALVVVKVAIIHQDIICLQQLNQPQKLVFVGENNDHIVDVHDDQDISFHEKAWVHLGLFEPGLQHTIAKVFVAGVSGIFKTIQILAKL